MNAPARAYLCEDTRRRVERELADPAFRALEAIVAALGKGLDAGNYVALAKAALAGENEAKAVLGRRDAEAM